MNSAKFKSTLSWKLNFLLEYCWLPVAGRRENFVGFQICIICQTMVIIFVKWSIWVSVITHQRARLLPCSPKWKGWLFLIAQAKWPNAFPYWSRFVWTDVNTYFGGRFVHFSYRVLSCGCFFFVILWYVASLMGTLWPTPSPTGSF